MIPKNIFQVSINLNHYLNEIQNQINKTKTLNPEYKYTLITQESEMDDFVNNFFPGEIADCYNKLNIIVAKVDFWRYLVLYKYGGVYLDMDSSIEKPLDELIKQDDESIITAEGNPYFYVQWALIFNKEHPILKQVVELIVDNIKNNTYPNDIHKMTGPTVYSKAINIIHNNLFYEDINRNDININTNITYNLNNIKYRLYGIDYSGYFCFKYNDSYLLYEGKKHWRQEQQEKQLLKN
jgi:mannosyltransferase OCH1-like enzyme